jgi:bifunctional non-homologous end joining protein LigD
MHVEDHPLEYGDFEGTIPKGEYGGGTVLVWDRGTWEPIGDPHKGYREGNLKFALTGDKLQGERGPSCGSAGESGATTGEAGS